MKHKRQTDPTTAQLGTFMAISRAQPLESLPEFLTPEEFGAYMELGRGTVYELLRRAEIPHRRFGRLIRIHKSVLTSFLNP